MKKKVTKHKPYVHPRHHERPVRWLPIHGRFITPFFKFSSVRGTARLFIEIEITLTLLVLLGTLVIVLLKMGLLIIK